jgi:hypothetical protein
MQIDAAGALLSIKPAAPPAHIYQSWFDSRTV